MSTQRSVAMHRTPEISTLPADVSSPQAKLVFHSLDAAGEATADELAERLCMKKIALFGVLDSLSKRGYVENRDGRYVAVAS